MIPPHNPTLLEAQLQLATEQHPQIQKWAATVARAVEDVLGPTAHDALLGCALLDLAVIWRESNGDPNAVAGDDHGLQQINSKAHPEFFTKTLPDGTPAWRDPLENIREGLRILLWGLGRWPGNSKAGVATYNAGPKLVSKGITDKGDPDAYTTGHDYGRDVQARRDKLRAHLNANLARLVVPADPPPVELPVATEAEPSPGELAKPDTA